MATWNGTAIFGACQMTHANPPNAAQINKYPGTIGIQRRDFGPAEGYTMVEGVISSDSPTDLGAAINSIRVLKNNGNIGTLLDNQGLTWNDAIIVEFETTGPTGFTPGGGSSQDYVMKILHTRGG